VDVVVSSIVVVVVSSVLVFVLEAVVVESGNSVEESDSVVVFSVAVSLVVVGLSVVDVLI
jgi:hypothetical protein